MLTINFVAKNVVAENMNTVSNMIAYKVRTHEYNAIIQSKFWKDCVSALDTAHPNCDVFSVIESDAKPALGDDYDSFMEKRKEVIALKKELANLPTEEQYNALSEVDKTFVCIYAHTVTKGIKLDKAIIKDMDVTNAIAAFYKQGSMKKAKDILRSVFNNTCGKDGNLFYGVRLKKSDFNDEDVRTCLAYFRGNASQGKKKDANGNVVVTSYNWVNRDGSVDAQMMAITNLFGVVLSSRLKDWTRPTVDVEEKIETEEA